MPHILICSENNYLARAVELIIEMSNDVKSISKVRDFKELIKKVRGSDYIFLDDNDGVWQRIRKLFIIRRVNPDVKVFSLNTGLECDLDNIAQSTFSGEEGFNKQAVLTIVRKINNIDYLSEAESENGFRKSNIRNVKIPLLSNRENKVLSLVLKGKTNGEISRSLDINQKTVSTYRRKMYEKLGVGNIAALFNLFF